MKTVIMVIFGSALASCSTGYTEPPLSASHPANPQANAAPLAERSDTLVIHDSAKSALATGATSSPVAEHHHMHGEQPSTTQADVQENAPVESNAAHYVCPMHPDITSAKPDQRCPKCGMKLVAKTEGGQQP